MIFQKGGLIYHQNINPLKDFQKNVKYQPVSPSPQHD